ncbi:MAG: UTP--glucose-phosphate uridylyltransferase [Thermoleophilales bacterium]|nr:UTP--glucose-phosphate uridylyltransferase [Thermoleophilales bacterium]
MNDDGLTASVEKMRGAGLPDIAIDNFKHYYELLQAGESGMMPESEIEPVADLPDAADLPEPDDDILDRTVIVKLNGGLGTSMGMTKAKSLLEVKDGLTFLDVTVRQVRALREHHGARLPLVLMNSFATRDDTLAALERYPELEVDVPIDFVQGRVPKIKADDLQPVEWPDDPAKEWAPPGHGDIYTAIVTSGMLEALLGAGYEYAFVSNSDNLGAVLDPRIVSWFAREELPFAMEVTDRTEADRKGGHLARRRENGRLVLRETAQTPEEDLEKLQDISRHRFVNTNNLWINLRALQAALEERDGVLGLPMIVNKKTVDPGDKSSPEVFQLETAMGAAIGVFEGAGAIRVSRRRFAPVKTTDDLLGVRSDAYVLTGDFRVELAPERDGPPFIDLDDAFYKLVGDFEARFPAGPPSLVQCERLVVEGDVTFGRGVVVRGSVTIEGPREVPDGEVLEG